MMPHTFALVDTLRLIVIELPKEIRILLGDLAVDLQAGVCPAANPLAVVQVGTICRSVGRVRFMITAAGADRPGPAGRAIGLAVDVMRLQEVLLLVPRHAVTHVAERMIVGAGEAVAQREVAAGGHAHQADTGAARIRLGMTVMKLLQRLADVRETVMAIL